MIWLVAFEKINLNICSNDVFVYLCQNECEFMVYVKSNNIFCGEYLAMSDICINTHTHTIFL